MKAVSILSESHLCTGLLPTIASILIDNQMVAAA
jgi:hypothetical protein